MAIQLQSFAEQVLFGTTLEEKLSFPREEIVDTEPGDAIRTPIHLPRPKDLELRSNEARAVAPKGSRLIDEKERGRLLHFFGNHELLATELMALVLLKFPEAPSSFRQGVLETLKEEQIHTKLYIHRMKQCGVEFGELPLSDYFWKSVSSMEDPLDYVTRLSLTFEQANLDYSREYAQLFQAVGDDATAGILDKIYKDEIDHVGFGLKWFRKWKASGKTDWEAFRERLVFPLSPARAKGNAFNREGRLSAGLDERFVDDLQVFQQSRGRTPTVFWFNPDAEHFAAVNSGDSAASGNSVVQRDLEFLPAYLSRKDDIVVLNQRPTQKFLAGIQNKGIQLPELLEAGGQVCSAMDRKIGAIRPWAWTPESLRFFKGNFEGLTRKVNTDTLWNAEIRNLFSKVWSAEWGRGFEESAVESEWNAPVSVYGKPLSNLDEVRGLRDEFRSDGYNHIVFKAPFGTASGGNRCLMAGELLGPVLRTWLDSVIKEQGEVVVEPWLDRVYDFSIQFDMGSSGLKLLAFTRLINNSRGQFRGIVCNGFCKDADRSLTRFLMERSTGRPRVYSWFQDVLTPRLEAVLKRVGYKGPIGLDTMVYRDPEGQLRLKSVVEVNPRYTMGRVAHELSLNLGAGSVGLFQIVSRKQVRKRFRQGLVDFVDSLEKNAPVKTQDEGRARILKGSFALNDPAKADRFLALFHARRSMDDIKELLSQF